jgi:selenocysteine-specific elongation factor
MLSRLVDKSGIEGIEIGDLVAGTGLRENLIREILESSDNVFLTVETPLRAVAQSLLKQAGDSIVEMIEAFLKKNPLSPGILKGEIREKLFKKASPAHFQSLLDYFSKQYRIEVREEYVLLPGRQISLDSGQEEIRNQLILFAGRKKFQPVAIDELVSSSIAQPEELRMMIHHMIRSGDLNRINEDLLILPEFLEQMIQKMRAHFYGDNGFSVPQFKESFSLSRKYAIPILEYLDRQRITRRSGDKRFILSGTR